MAKQNFLEDERDLTVSRNFSVGDGFKFGFGFILAWLLVALLVSGVAWLAILVFHLH